MNFWYVKGAPDPAWITAEKIKAYSDDIKEGEILDGPRGKKAKILRKYKHFAITNIGTMLYTDLYMFNVRRLDCNDTNYIFTDRRIT